MNYFKEFLFNRGRLLSKIVKPIELENFLERFRANYISVDLIRIGAENDGGYLVPNMMNKISHCFSPGVDNISEFEKHLSKLYGIKSFMADASVSGTHIEDSNFSFIKKYIGSKTKKNFITLKDWLDSSLNNSENELILQMDIEGSEYDVLIIESEHILKKFSIMVIEFHAMENIFDKFFLKTLSSIFEKIYRDFSICHVHPNNCGEIVSYGEIEVPKVIEVTFIRNDHLKELAIKNLITLPHELDNKNVKDKKDIYMPEKWWKK